MVSPPYLGLVSTGKGWARGPRGGQKAVSGNSCRPHSQATQRVGPAARLELYLHLPAEWLAGSYSASRSTCPISISYEMSDSQDPTTSPVVTTQVELGGCSWQGGGNGFLRFRQHQEVQAFLSLLEDSFVQEFLSKDPCFQISDKYLLAMVLVYFQRAHLKLSEYTHSSLFLALYLANDMEEDLEGPKCEIFPWALGKDWCLRVGKFLHQRDKLWARMGFRAVVSRQCCEEVMAKEPFHWAWTRDRRPHHGGVQRVCPQVPVHLPRGPGLSPPHCSPCGLPQHCSHHQLKPVSSKCPSLTSECHRPPSQNYLSRVKNAWGGDFLIVLPPQMQLEPGTYSLHIFPKPPARPGH
nr:speedy protein C isoform X3 [Chlorocebus sabaeus]